MKYSLCLAAAGALLAAASPLAKREYNTNGPRDTVGQESNEVDSDVRDAILSQPDLAPGNRFEVTEGDKKYLVEVVKEKEKTTNPVVPPSVDEGKPAARPVQPKVTSESATTNPVVPVSVDVGKPAPPTQDPKDPYQTQMLDAHNNFRATHNFPPLAYNVDLATKATELAKKTMVDAGRCNMSHVEDGLGQNLAFTGSDGQDFLNLRLDYAVKAVSEDWIKKELAILKSMGNKRPDPAPLEIGHLTQVAWRSTKEVGCDTIQCPNGIFVGDELQPMQSWYTVCEYSPRGNFPGQFNSEVWDILDLVRV